MSEMDDLKARISRLESLVESQKLIQQELARSVAAARCNYGIFEKPLRMWYRKYTGRLLDFNNPVTFNDKIQWLKLYGDMPLMTRWADKANMRHEVGRLGLSSLNPLIYAVLDFPQQLNPPEYPSIFIIKTNHASAQHAFVDTGSKTFNLTQLMETCSNWLEINYAFNAFEMQYANIQPKILLEEWLGVPDKDFLEYKVWCFNGQPKYIQYHRTPHGAGTGDAFYDAAWKKQDFHTRPPVVEEIEKPDQLEEMLEYSRILSTLFPFVRVDFFITKDERLYLNELTFTPGGGILRFSKKEMDYELGREIRLPV